MIMTTSLMAANKRKAPQVESRGWKRFQSTAEISTSFEKRFIKKISPGFINEFLQSRSHEERNYTQSYLKSRFKVEDLLDNDKVGTNIFRKICGAKCEARKEIKVFKNLNFFHTSSSMIPDISVYNDNSPILFAEVESNNDFTSTIRKLCLVLVAQLIHLRNMDTQKTHVCGFAMPLQKSEEDKTTGGVVLVKITWERSLLAYFADFQAVTIDKFEETVRYIYDTQKHWSLAHLDPAEFHCFPMGSTEISFILKTELKEECILRSTSSLMAFTDGNVFKLSLAATDGLDDFYAACIINRLSPSQVLLPISTISHFLCFRRLQGPAHLDVCNNCLRSFSVSVYNAIKQLHKCGYAHLDLQLQNICYKQEEGKDEWIAVLIDLDTVCKKDDWPMRGNKYLIKYGMTGEQNDWRQYAVLIDCVHRKLIVDEEYTPKFEGELQFLQSSYAKGEKPNLQQLCGLPGDEPITEKLWEITC